MSNSSLRLQCRALARLEVEPIADARAVPRHLNVLGLDWQRHNIRPECADALASGITHAWIDNPVAVGLTQGAGELLRLRVVGNVRVQQRGKALQVVNTYEASPPYILANFPKAEVQFMCLDSNDPELGRPRLKKTPDSVIEIKGSTPQSGSKNQSDLYAELVKLDDLRKRGIITEAEFDAQKRKLLSE